MRKYFRTGRLIPCYTEEGRCKWCRGQLPIYSLALVEVFPNLWALADDILEPVRVSYGKPIRVLRGFLCRTKMKNLLEQCETEEQRADMEQYRKGEAVDITAVAGMPRKMKGVTQRELDAKPTAELTREENLKIAKLIEALGGFDQLVYENCDEQGRPEWLRLSYKRKGGNRNIVMYNYKK